MLFDTFIEQLPLKVFQDNHISYGKKLGEGGNAEVYKLTVDNHDYAGKIYENPNLEDILSELEVAKKLENTKQCVKTYGILVSDNDGKIIILMELLKSYGDLYDYTSNIAKWTACYRIGNSKELFPKPKSNYVYFNKDENTYWCYELSEKQKIRITMSLVKAVQELHKNGIIHGDIKTNNMVLHYLYKKQIIKLIDFGMSYFSDTEEMIDIEYKCGTLGYRAPEQEEYQMNYKSDIYSMAATIIEMWNGDIWMDGESFRECRKELLCGLRKLEKNNKELGNLLRKSLSLDHKKRPTAERFVSTLKKIISNNDHKYKNNLQV